MLCTAAVSWKSLKVSSSCASFMLAFRSVAWQYQPVVGFFWELNNPTDIVRIESALEEQY